MSMRNRVVLVVAVLSLAVLVGCGSGSNPATAPPTGGFSNSNLNGTYVFSTLGTDSSTTPAPITIVGAFTACGCSAGTISGGTFSFFDPNIGSPESAQSITGGTYGVTTDGRGQAHLTTGTALGTIVLDFALTSTSGGTVTLYGTIGTGSGTIDAQSTVTQSDINGQSYAFSITGDGSGGMFSSVGAFTLSTTGSVSSGVQDITTLNTSNGLVSTQAGVEISTSSTVAVGTGTAPGTAQIDDVDASNYTFDVYPVSATHLKFIETDGVILSSGDAFTQSTSLPSGTLVFTMGGLDSSGGPLAVGGFLPTSNNTIGGGLEDYNDGGTANTTSTVSGTFGTLSNGRSVLSLASFVNGATNNLAGTYAFAAYPSTGGTLLLEIDGSGITAGGAMVQTNTSLASSQGYAVNLSASNFVNGCCVEEDDIAEFTATGSAFSGLIDVNDQGTLNFDKTFSGSYQSASTGRYTFTASSSFGFDGMVYTVDGSNLLFLETDNDQVGTGVFQVQNATGSTAAAAANVSRFASSLPRLAARRASKLRAK